MKLSKLGGSTRDPNMADLVLGSEPLYLHHSLREMCTKTMILAIL